MLKIIYAPNRLNVIGTTIFLAGSIEMGIAEEWQTRVENHLKDIDVDITLLNPRRNDWDFSWEQTIDNLQFREQVEWELDALEKADVIFLYLSPGTKSPISLLELGLFIHKKLVVCCPKEFWRKGNVDIVCKRYKHYVYDDFKQALSCLKSQISWKYDI